MIPTVKDALNKKKIIDEINSINLQATELCKTDPDQCRKLAEKALKLSDKLHYTRGTALSLHLLGVASLSKGDFNEAVEKSRQALDIFTELDDQDGISSTLNTLGITLRNIGSYDRALDFLMRALELQRKMNNPRTLSKLYVNIGNIYENKGMYKEGLEYYRKCLEIDKSYKDDEGTADVHSNLGVCYRHLGQYSKGMRSHKRALKIWESLGNQRGIAFSLDNMGAIYRENGKYRRALNYHLDALDIKIRCDMKNEIARSCNTIGHLYTIMKDYEMAAQYLRKGEGLSVELDSQLLMRDNHLFLSQLHIATGDHRKALEHHIEYYRIDREIFDSNRISNMEIQLELMHNELYAANRKLEKANARLSKLSITDELTGLHNRRHFREFLDVEWSRCNRNSRPISLILVDIDFFKPYNDTYGHTLGDDCLKSISGVLDRCAQRPTDMVARYGGEEFVLVLSETGREGAMKVAGLVRNGVEDLGIPHESSSVADVVTVSVGLSTMIPEKGHDPGILVERSDLALYRSKSDGRNMITFYEESSFS